MHINVFHTRKLKFFLKLGLECSKTLDTTTPSLTALVKMIPGEMVNLRKVNWPKSQLAKKVNSLKTPNMAFWLFYAQVDFLASWLFGQLTFWRLNGFPSIEFTDIVLS